MQNQELSTEDDLTTSLTESGRMRELQDKVSPSVWGWSALGSEDDQHADHENDHHEDHDDDQCEDHDDEENDGDDEDVNVFLSKNV